MRPDGLQRLAKVSRPAVGAAPLEDEPAIFEGKWI
jgi:hypothetical protein